MQKPSLIASLFLILSEFLLLSALASDNNIVLDTGASGGNEWVVLSKIDITKKTERLKYAEFLKEKHYLPLYRTIPELTPKEKEWIKNREKDINDTLNGIKDKNTPMMKSEEGRTWLAMDARYRSSTLYLQNELKKSLNNVVTALNIVIESKNVLGEMLAWSLLIDNLLDYPLNGDNLHKAINALESDRGLIFSGDNFLLQNMSAYIAREINRYIIFGYFEGKIM